MKKLVLTLATALICFFSFSQQDAVKKIASLITTNEVEAHLTFLASDEMRGRNTGSPEIDIAANYIASYFKQIGLKPAPNTTNYFQQVSMISTRPPSGAILAVENQQFKLNDDLVLLSGQNLSVTGDIVFIGYGTRDEMEKASVKGKIVVAFAGTAEEPNIAKAFLSDGPAKNKIAAELGAVALIEILAIPGMPWGNLVGFISRERLTLKQEGGDIPHLWMKNTDHEVIKKLQESRKSTGSLTVSGSGNKLIADKNVAAVVEGTDPKLRNEYIVISAHYDHVGVTKVAGREDSIYNGARDNAIGTVGMMATAKYFAQHPPKRSVLFLALTAEEKGLLGSAWYAAHPLVPLNKTVFNFNCDGAGYNDKTIATVIGLERTTAEADISKACEAFGLKATQDPVPEQNLYERSDNYNFAVKGIPAIDFAPGVKAFDEELMKYYHQPADEVATLDFDYLIKYFRAYVYANHLISNNAQTPSWKAGDKFEEAAKKLYGK
jgi:hypothetical protein